jgi:hypothetical protein
MTKAERFMVPTIGNIHVVFIGAPAALTFPVFRAYTFLSSPSHKKDFVIH